jgi:16S rRNA processing protein RimM
MMAEFGRAHGVRGLVRLHAYTEDPRDLARYALTDEAGVRRFAITLLPDGLARVDGVADRDAAQRLTGTKLYVDRAALPPPAEEEFLLVDLEGLAAFDAAGASLGQVVAVEDHGAGAYLTLAGPAGEKLVPFTRRCVPVVDIAAGRIMVDLPVEIVIASGAKGAAA